MQKEKLHSSRTARHSLKHSDCQQTLQGYDTTYLDDDIININPYGLIEGAPKKRPSVTKSNSTKKINQNSEELF